METIRAGLVMQLKEAVGAEYIMIREKQLCRMARERLKGAKNIELLGNQDLPGLPVLSFMVRHPETG